MSRTMRACLCIALVGWTVVLGTQATRGDQPKSIRIATWLTMSHTLPNVLYLGGVDTDTFFSSCPSPCKRAWAMRSDNGGNSWVDISKSMTPYGTDSVDYSPIQISADDRNLYVNVIDHISPDSGFADVLRSTDRGAHWSSLDGTDHGKCAGPGYSGGFGALTLDPRVPKRVYAVCYSPVSAGSDLRVSNDGGSTWIPRAVPDKGIIAQIDQPRPRPQPGPLYVPDRHQPDTLYANVPIDLYSPQQDPNGTHVSASVIRSNDAGIHWTPVQPPAKIPLLSFGVTTDGHAGQALIGLVNASNVPGDRIYISWDEGRTWHAGTCPGDFNHQCPRFIVDNVFGAGASYAFIGDGIRRFVDIGPATQLLPLGALPFRSRDIVAVGAVSRPNGSVFVLTSTMLYRSTDGGTSWTSQRVNNLP